MGPFYQPIPAFPGGIVENTLIQQGINYASSAGYFPTPLHVANGSFTDAYANRYYEQVAQQAFATAAQGDARRTSMSMQGLVAGSGRQVTPDMRLAFDNMSRAAFSNIGPNLTYTPFGRGLLDSMAGGVSELNISSAAMLAGRTMNDPFTGRMGTGAAFTSQLSSQLATQLIAGGRYGFKGDEIGNLMLHMQSRGELQTADTMSALINNNVLANAIDAGVVGDGNLYDMGLADVGALRKQLGIKNSGELAAIQAEFTAATKSTNRKYRRELAAQTSEQLDLALANSTSEIDVSALSEDAFNQKLLQLGSLFGSEAAFQNKEVASDLAAAYRSIGTDDFNKTGFAQMSRQERLAYVAAATNKSQDLYAKGLSKLSDFDITVVGGHAGDTIVNDPFGNKDLQAQEQDVANFMNNGSDAARKLSAMSQATTDRMTGNILERVKALASVRDLLKNRGLDDAMSEVVRVAEDLSSGSFTRLGSINTQGLVRRFDATAREMGMSLEQMQQINAVSRQYTQSLGFRDDAAALPIATDALMHARGLQSIGAFQNVGYGEGNSDQILQQRMAFSAGSVQSVTGDVAGTLSRLVASGQIKEGTPAGDKLMKIYRGLAAGDVSPEQANQLLDTEGMSQLMSEASGKGLGYIYAMQSQRFANEKALMTQGTNSGLTDVVGQEVFGSVLVQAGSGGIVAAASELQRRGDGRGAAVMNATDSIGRAISQAIRDGGHTIYSLSEKDRNAMYGQTAFLNLQQAAASGDASAAQLLQQYAGKEDELRTFLTNDAIGMFTAEAESNSVSIGDMLQQFGGPEEKARRDAGIRTKITAMIDQFKSGQSFGGKDEVIQQLQAITGGTDATLLDAVAAGFNLDTGGQGQKHIQSIIDMLGGEGNRVNQRIEALRKAALAKTGNNEAAAQALLAKDTDYQNALTAQKGLSDQMDALLEQAGIDTVNSDRSANLLQEAKQRAVDNDPNNASSVTSAQFNNVTIELAGGEIIATGLSGKTRGSRSSVPGG